MHWVSHLTYSRIMDCLFPIPMTGCGPLVAYSITDVLPPLLQAVYWISYLTYLGVAWYALGIGYLFGALLGPLQVTGG